VVGCIVGKEVVDTDKCWSIGCPELTERKEQRNVYKMILTEVIAQGKGEQDRAYREKSQRIFDRYGVPHKVWNIEGRKMGQVLVEFGPFGSREESEAAGAKVFTDDEWQALQQERIEAGVVVPGTQDILILTD
jgi:hypothetical protein